MQNHQLTSVVGGCSLFFVRNEYEPGHVSLRSIYRIYLLDTLWCKAPRQTT